VECIFCQIAEGAIPNVTLWEDDETLAFLDIRPLRPGHALVIPKTHAARLADASPASMQAVMATVQRLTPVITQLTGSTDATIAIHDGPAAGQEVPHLHVHIVPRQPGDGGGPIHALFDRRSSVSSEEMHDFAIQVQQLVAQ